MGEIQNEMPACIGMIMDGNRRYAQERGLPTIEGHRAGYEKLKEAAQWCRDAGVHNLVVYAFSTENWNRGAEEVEYLMQLMRTLLTDKRQELQEKEHVAVHVVGDLGRFPDDIVQSIKELHANNPVDAVDHLWVAASYGGRAELAAALSALAATKAGPYSEEDIQNALWTRGMPDPELIIRTGGQHRLSNFLPWQSVYSELYFLDTYWPDLSREEFQGILDSYAHKQRNFGV